MNSSLFNEQPTQNNASQNMLFAQSSYQAQAADYQTPTSQSLFGQSFNYSADPQAAPGQGMDLNSQAFYQQQFQGQRPPDQYAASQFQQLGYPMSQSQRYLQPGGSMNAQGGGQLNSHSLQAQPNSLQRGLFSAEGEGMGAQPLNYGAEFGAQAHNQAQYQNLQHHSNNMQHSQFGQNYSQLDGSQLREVKREEDTSEEVKVELDEDEDDMHLFRPFQRQEPQTKQPSLRSNELAGIVKEQVSSEDEQEYDEENQREKRQSSGRQAGYSESESQSNYQHIDQNRNWKFKDEEANAAENTNLDQDDEEENRGSEGEEDEEELDDNILSIQDQVNQIVASPSPNQENSQAMQSQNCQMKNESQPSASNQIKSNIQVYELQNQTSFPSHHQQQQQHDYIHSAFQLQPHATNQLPHHHHQMQSYQLPLQQQQQQQFIQLPQPQGFQHHSFGNTNFNPQFQFFQQNEQVAKHSFSQPHQSLNLYGMSNPAPQLHHQSQGNVNLGGGGLMIDQREQQQQFGISQSLTIQQNNLTNIKQESQGFDISQSLNSQSLEEENEAVSNQQPSQIKERSFEEVHQQDYQFKEEQEEQQQQQLQTATVQAYDFQGIKDGDDQTQPNSQEQELSRVKEEYPNSPLLHLKEQQEQTKQQPAPKFQGLNQFLTSARSAFSKQAYRRQQVKEEEEEKQSWNGMKLMGQDSMYFNISDNILKMLEQDESEKQTQGGSSLFQTQTSSNKLMPAQVEKRSENNKLIKVTLRLVELLQRCNPGYLYQPLFNPKRDLTQPSEGVLNNGYDNAESDYILRVGEHITTPEGRDYEILDLMGKGTFGQVVKCACRQNKEMVAVKVIKNKKAFKNQGVIEIKILDILNRVYDPNGEAAIVRMLDFFVFRNHLCVVFELLSASLYDMLKETSFNGVSLNFSRLIISKILEGMKVLKEARLIHCDLKPENILFKTKENVNLKIIDVGSACFEGHGIFQYIQSRYYRSPEVILGLPYDSGIDMWSLGCICAELFLGIPIFPGNSEYDQLTKIIEILGLPPQHMIARAKYKTKYFVFMPEYQQYRFKTFEEFQITNGIRLDVPKKYLNLTCLDDLKIRFLQKKQMEQIAQAQKENKQINPYTFQPRIQESEMNTLEAFIDFLKGVLRFERENRWSPNMAMSHPFITRNVYNGPYEPSRDLDRKSTTQSFDESMSERSPSSRDSKDYKAGSCPSKILYPQTASAPQYLQFQNANFQPVFMANQKKGQQQQQWQQQQMLRGNNMQMQNPLAAQIQGAESSIESHRPPILSIPDEYFKGFMFNKLDQILSMTKDQLIQFVYEQNEINYRQQQAQRQMLMQQQQSLYLQQQQFQPQGMMINQQQQQIPLMMQQHQQIQFQGASMAMNQQPMLMNQMRQPMVGSQPDMMVAGFNPNFQMPRQDFGGNQMQQPLNPMMMPQIQMQMMQMNQYMMPQGMNRMFPNESIILNPPPYQVQKTQLTNADAQNDPNFLLMQQQRMMAFKGQRANNQGKPGSWQPPQGMQQQKYNKYYNQIQNPGQLIGRQNEIQLGEHKGGHNQQMQNNRTGGGGMGNFNAGMKQEKASFGSVTTSKDFKKLKERKNLNGGESSSKIPTVILEEPERLNVSSPMNSAFQPSSDHLEQKGADQQQYFSIFKDNFKPQFHQDYQPIQLTEQQPKPAGQSQMNPSPKIMNSSMSFLQQQKQVNSFQSQHSRNQSINNNNSGGIMKDAGADGFNPSGSFVSNLSTSKMGQGEKGFLKKFEHQTAGSSNSLSQGQDNNGTPGQKTFINTNHHHQHQHLHRNHMPATENQSHHKQSMSQILSSSINQGAHSSSFHSNARSRADSDQVINDESNSQDQRSNDGKLSTSKLSINLNSEQPEHSSSQNDLLLSTKSRKTIQFDDLKDQILKSSFQQQNSFLIMQNQPSARGGAELSQSINMSTSMPNNNALGMQGPAGFGGGQQKRQGNLPVPGQFGNQKPPIYQGAKQAYPIQGSNPFGAGQPGQMPQMNQGSQQMIGFEYFAPREQGAMPVEQQQQIINEQIGQIQQQLHISMQQHMMCQNDPQMLQSIKQNIGMLQQKQQILSQRAQFLMQQKQQQYLLQQNQIPLIKHGGGSQGNVSINNPSMGQVAGQNVSQANQFRQRENSDSFNKNQLQDEEGQSPNSSQKALSFSRTQIKSEDQDSLSDAKYRNLAQDIESCSFVKEEVKNPDYDKEEDENMYSQSSQLQFSDHKNRKINAQFQEQTQPNTQQQQMHPITSDMAHQQNQHAQYQMLLYQQQQQQQQQQIQIQMQQQAFYHQQQQMLQNQQQQQLAQQLQGIPLNAQHLSMQPNPMMNLNNPMNNIANQQQLQQYNLQNQQQQQTHQNQQNQYIRDEFYRQNY